MGGDKSHAAGEALLLRLRRLIARARAAGRERKELLALLDDIETARRGLIRESEAIEDETRQTSVRTTAIGAYLRGAQIGRGRRHN
ncbi:hypothetical protein Q3C01_38945 [Bradyrhizobium sp. UFLA05-109]